MNCCASRWSLPGARGRGSTSCSDCRRDALTADDVAVTTGGFLRGRPARAAATGRPPPGEPPPADRCVRAGASRARDDGRQRHARRRRPARPGRGALADRRPARRRRGVGRVPDEWSRIGPRPRHRGRGHGRPGPSGGGATTCRAGLGSRRRSTRAALRRTAEESDLPPDPADPAQPAGAFFGDEGSRPAGRATAGAVGTTAGAVRPTDTRPMTTDEAGMPGEALPASLWDAHLHGAHPHAALPAPALPDGPTALDAARRALDAGKAQDAVVQLGIVLRVSPALAPAVLDVAGSTAGAGFDLIRGDAYRLVGHEAEAQRAYASAASTLAGAGASGPIPPAAEPAADSAAPPDAAVTGDAAASAEP